MSWRLHLFCFCLWLSLGVIYGAYPENFLLRTGFLFLFPLLWFFIAFTFAMKAFLIVRSQRETLGKALVYSLAAFFNYPYFYWYLRLNLSLKEEEKKKILQEFSKLSGVSLPSSILCPFCKLEIEDALKASSDGKTLIPKRRPLLCSKCNLRIDACRYCLFFEKDSSPFRLDITTSGKCTVIKKAQPVEELCDVNVAQRLKAMGWHTLYAGIRISDPFSPPENCRSFVFDSTKMLSDKVTWMGRERILLLQIEASLYSQLSSSESG